MSDLYFGALKDLIQDPEITEIMVNDTRNVCVELRGKLQILNGRIESTDELLKIANSILKSAGRTLTAAEPYATAALPDGSRVHLVGPPVSPSGITITIRRFPKRHTLEDLVRARTLDTMVYDYLKDAVQKRKSILISGGTGSGKTTLLNSLMALFPSHERVVAMEDSAELVLKQENHVKLITIPRTASSTGVTLKQLIHESLRMRPDRIVIGECRGDETLDFLNAMVTGHAGSLTTIHGTRSRDALSRLETLALFSAADVPIQAVRRYVGSAIQIVVQLRRANDGTRFISEICEITGVEENAYVLHQVFQKNLPQEEYQSIPSAIGIEF